MSSVLIDLTVPQQEEIQAGGLSALHMTDYFGRRLAEVNAVFMNQITIVAKEARDDLITEYAAEKRILTALAREAEIAHNKLNDSGDTE